MISDAPGNSAVREEWVVVHAVTSEPASRRRIPVLHGIYRDFEPFLGLQEHVSNSKAIIFEGLRANDNSIQSRDFGSCSRELFRLIRDVDVLSACDAPQL